LLFADKLQFLATVPIVNTLAKKRYSLSRMCEAGTQRHKAHWRFIWPRIWRTASSRPIKMKLSVSGFRNYFRLIKISAYLKSGWQRNEQQACIIINIHHARMPHPTARVHDRDAATYRVTDVSWLSSIWRYVRIQCLKQWFLYCHCAFRNSGLDSGKSRGLDACCTTLLAVAKSQTKLKDDWRRVYIQVPTSPFIIRPTAYSHYHAGVDLRPSRFSL